MPLGTRRLKLPTSTGYSFMGAPQKLFQCKLLHLHSINRAAGLMNLLQSCHATCPLAGASGLLSASLCNMHVV